MTESYSSNIKSKSVTPGLIQKKRLNKLVRFSWHKKALLTYFLIGLSQLVFAQTIDTSSNTQIPDTSITSYVDRIKQAAKRDAQKSFSLFEEDKIAFRQNELIEKLRTTSLRAREYLKRGVDSHRIHIELGEIKALYEVAGDGVFTNKGTAYSYRNLTTTSKLLAVLLNRATIRKHQLDKYQKDLFRFRYQLDSLSSDTAFYEFPSDSTAFTSYLRKVVVLARNEVNPTDSALKLAIANVHELQTDATVTVNKIAVGLEEIDSHQKELFDRTFEREFPNLWATTGYDRALNEIVHFSRAKGRLTFFFYAGSHWGKISLVVILVVIASVYLRRLRRIYIDKKLLQENYTGQLVLRHPELSATMIVLNLFQFIFPEPPFVFNALFWVISAVCLTIIFRGFISRQWMYFWLAMLTFFLLACVENLILEASRPERWFLLVLASAGVIVGAYALLRGRIDELKEKWIIYFIVFVVVLETASVVANLYGRYSLSKTLLVGGYCNVIIGILFLWTIRLINEGLSLASNAYTGQDKKLFYINFDRVGSNAPPLFYGLLIFGWFILFARNFYAFKLISDPVENFLFDNRTIGDYTFSISNLLSFILILGLSFLASRIVSFFASDKNTGPVGTSKDQKAGIGSWLLLVRIGIISLGFFLAIQASDLALDRVTIVLGALGVGVGLGLQALVSNLVSGLILAFERPVNVGDFVEVAGRSGIIKSIGFRSSIISTWSGPDVVIPNGDLLNSQMVNWTKGGNKQRLLISIKVAYGTVLEKANQLVTDIMNGDERILKYPAPSVFLENFDNSAIDMRVLFWVRHFRESRLTKSDLIRSIYDAFGKNGIVIPIPQHELHIHSLDKNGTSEKKPASEEESAKL